MSKKMYTPIRLVTILSFVLALFIGTTWAVQTYNGSMTVRKGRGGTIRFVTASLDGSRLLDILDPLGIITIKVRRGALDDYMEEQDLHKVQITVDLEEELIEREDGSSYYRLDFTFGPSGAFFTPPLEVHLTGKYVKNGAEVWLYDENGEELEGERYNLLDTIVFKVPHFSSYSYDHY